MVRRGAVDFCKRPGPRRAEQHRRITHSGAVDAAGPIATPIVRHRSAAATSALGARKRARARSIFRPGLPGFRLGGFTRLAKEDCEGGEVVRCPKPKAQTPIGSSRSLSASTSNASRRQRGENVVDYDMSESGVRPLTLRELAAMGFDLDTFLDQPLGYSRSNGGPQPFASGCRGSTPAPASTTSKSPTAPRNEKLPGRPQPAPAG